MKRKIIKYLKKKNQSEYSELDKIFTKYLDGSLENLLCNLGFSNIEIFPQIRRRANYLQLNFWYRNLVVDLGFDEEDFDYCVYLPGISAKEFEQGFVKFKYNENFNIEDFFKKFQYELSCDKRLKN